VRAENGCVKKVVAAEEKAMTEYGGCYELLDSKGERVGTAYVEHAGPLSRWGWFAYVNGDAASNACLETSKHAFEELEDTVKRYGLSMKQPAQATEEASSQLVEEGLVSSSPTASGQE
jgi:hypothetical protein